MVLGVVLGVRDGDSEGVSDAEGVLEELGDDVRDGVGDICGELDADGLELETVGTRVAGFVGMVVAIPYREDVLDGVAVDKNDELGSTEENVIVGVDSGELLILELGDSKALEGSALVLVEDFGSIDAVAD